MINDHDSGLTVLKCIALSIYLFAAITAPAWGDSLTIGLFTGPDGLGDHGITDSAYTGLIEAQGHYDFRLIIEEPGQTGSIRRKRLDTVISQSHVVILLGGIPVEWAVRAADRYPDKRFLTFESIGAARPNVREIAIDQSGGAFLAGALAGWMTRSRKVGFVGSAALRTPFMHGLRFADTGVTIVDWSFSEMELLAADQSWSKLSDVWSANGVDILFGASDCARHALLRAARRHPGQAIAMDLDRYHPQRPWVLSSLSRRLDRILLQEIIWIAEGRFEPGTKHYGIQEGAIELEAGEGGKVPIPASILARLEALTNRLRTGDSYPVDLAMDQP